MTWIARLHRAPEETCVTPSDRDDVIKSTIAALSTPGDDALTKAAADGIPDRGEVVEWVERTRALVLLERDRSVLRSELPYLAERLEKLLGKLPLPDGKPPRALVEDFIQRLPGGPDAARRGRRGGLRGGPRRPQLRRDRGLLSGAPRGRDLPDRAPALPARRADPAPHDDRARARPDRHRHQPGREDRPAFLHRPRHRRGDRRDHA